MLGSIRRRLVRKAFAKDPPSRTETWTIDGFEVVLDPAFHSPAPRFGWSYQSMVGGCIDARPGERVADLNSGAGLIALHAARRGARVACIDPRPPALRCIRRSFLMAGLGDPDLVPGSSLADAGDGPWDLITWTTPFLEPEPKATTGAVLAEARDRLHRGGRLLLAWPDREAGSWLGAELTHAGFRWSAILKASYPVVGPVRVYRAWNPPGGEPAGEVPSGDSLPGAAWVLRDR